MKKLLIILLALGLCAVFASCGGSAAPTGAFSEDDLGVALDGKTYYIRENSAELIAALGDGYEYSEVVSCVYDGKDKTFEYPGITVGTVPVDGEDVTEVITLTNSDYSTLRGAKVGDTVDSVKTLYGEGWFDDGYLTYSLTGEQSDIHAERIQFEYGADGVITRIFIYSPSY